MFRFLLLVIVVFALAVFMRLVLLRLKLLEMKAGAPLAEESKSRTRTIDAPQPLEVKSYMFTNFDYRTGPANREEFFENMYVNVGEVLRTAGGSDSNFTRTYSF